jgi:hypothetical protein
MEHDVPPHQSVVAGLVPAIPVFLRQHLRRRPEERASARLGGRATSGTARATRPSRPRCAGLLRTTWTRCGEERGRNAAARHADVSVHALIPPPSFPRKRESSTPCGQWDDRHQSECERCEDWMSATSAGMTIGGDEAAHLPAAVGWSTAPLHTRPSWPGLSRPPTSFLGNTFDVVLRSARQRAWKDGPPAGPPGPRVLRGPAARGSSGRRGREAERNVDEMQHHATVCRRARSHPPAVIPAKAGIQYAVWPVGRPASVRTRTL